MAISVLEKFFKSQILAVPAAATCFGAKFFNMFPKKSVFPYAVFQAIPLQHNFGQVRTSIQSRFFIDFRLYSNLPLPMTVDEAVEAVKEYFRTAEKTFYFENYAISIRHERPINLPVQDVNADDQIICRGSTYQVSGCPKCNWII
jgi:hypothetical protein